MILFRIDFERPEFVEGQREKPFFTNSLRNAREFAMAYLCRSSSLGVLVISRCATMPNKHGVALVLAALNDRDWMAPRSKLEIERWANHNGIPQTLSKPPRKATA